MIPLHPVLKDRFDLVLSSELPPQLGNETVFIFDGSSEHTISAAYIAGRFSIYFVLCVLLLLLIACIFSRSVRGTLCPCLIGVRAAPQDTPINAVAQLDAEGDTDQEKKALKRKRLEEKFSGIRQVSWFERCHGRAGLCSRRKD